MRRSAAAVRGSGTVPLYNAIQRTDRDATIIRLPRSRRSPLSVAGEVVALIIVGIACAVISAGVVNRGRTPVCSAPTGAVTRR